MRLCRSCDREVKATAPSFESGRLCDLPWPTECGRGDAMWFPSLSLERPCSCFLPPPAKSPATACEGAWSGLCDEETPSGAETVIPARPQPAPTTSLFLQHPGANHGFYIFKGLLKEAGEEERCEEWRKWGLPEVKNLRGGPKNFVMKTRF